MPRTRMTFELREKSKAARRFITQGETLPWYELRDFKADGLKFRKQSAVGPYGADFICFDPKLIVEVDEDQHDINRDAYFRSLGYIVLRCDAPDVLTNAWHVAQAVKREAEHCRSDPPGSSAATLPSRAR